MCVNLGGGVPDEWIDGDQLLEVGNGDDLGIVGRSNVTVLKNGYTAVGSHSVWPKSVLEVVHGNPFPSVGDLSQALSIVNKSNNESWQLHTRDSGSLLLYRKGDYRGYFHSDTGAYVQVSDRRNKKNIKSLPGGILPALGRLRPVSYLMKGQEGGSGTYGLIAQEVEEVFPTVAKYDSASDQYSLSYTELIPILIKAVQEQQGLIEAQNKRISALERTAISGK